MIRGRRTRTTIPSNDGHRSADQLNRDFFAPRPNHAWVTDFTYVPTWSGFVYVAFLIDLFSRAIVGWEVSTVKDTAFVERCLRMALWRRDHAGRPILPGMIHHSDASSQIGLNRWKQHLIGGLVASIGSVGDAYDNATAETVMGLYKNEATAKTPPFTTGPLRTMLDVEEITFDWVNWYNNARLHSALGNVPPEEYEQSYYAPLIGPSTDDAADKTAA